MSDVASCRLRRLAPTITVTAAPAACNTTFVEVLRPSGCSSYDPPQGGDGLTVSPLSGNIWYNSWRNLTTFLLEGGQGVDGEDDTLKGSAKAPAAAEAVDSADGVYGEDRTSVAGRTIRQCQGSPPPDRLDRAGNQRDAQVVDDGLTDVPEDTGVGTTIRLACPTSCTAEGGLLTGSVRGSPDFYTDDSAVCTAAVHAGLLNDSYGYDELGSVIVVVARLLPGNASVAARKGSFANNVTAGDAPAGWVRGFALELASLAEVTTQTVAGAPVGALGKGCGDARDGQPPQEAVFDRPAGIDAWRWRNLTNEVSARRWVTTKTTTIVAEVNLYPSA